MRLMSVHETQYVDMLGGLRRTVTVAAAWWSYVETAQLHLLEAAATTKP